MECKKCHAETSTYYEDVNLKRMSSLPKGWDAGVLCSRCCSAEKERRAKERAESPYLTMKEFLALEPMDCVMEQEQESLRKWGKNEPGW